MSDVYNITELSGDLTPNAMAFYDHVLLVAYGDEIRICYGKEEAPPKAGFGAVGGGVYLTKTRAVALLGVLQKIYPLDALAGL